MQIYQDDTEYKPITIRLVTKYEAETFFSIIDKVSLYSCNDGEILHLTPAEDALIATLSNANTEKVISF